MLAAANTVFSTEGYGKTTMAVIASVAGVAVQTLYFTFHTKADLLQATYEYVVTGADAVPPHLSSWWQSAEGEPILDRAVLTIVNGSIEIFARAAPLMWAVHSDPDARAAYEYNERLRREGNERIVEFLTEKKPLRDGLSLQRATDLFFTLLGPQLFMMLTTESGWSVDEYRAWVSRAILWELFER